MIDIEKFEILIKFYGQMFIGKITFELFAAAGST
jgi:hypothetical protein